MPPRCSADPVFAAFCAAGLWPGLGRTLGRSAGRRRHRRPGRRHRAEPRPAAEGRPGPRRPAVLVLRRRRRPTRCSSCSCRPAPSRGWPPAWSTLFGPPAPRLLRDDPWRLLALHGVTLADADRVAGSRSPACGATTRAAPARWSASCWPAQARDGHTVSPRDTVVDALREFGVGRRRRGDRRRARGSVGDRGRRRAAVA